MSDPRTQLEQLRRSLEGFGADDAVPASLGGVFNALLAEAKRDHPTDTIVAAVDPVGKTFAGSEFADIDCRSLEALVDQLLAALQG